MVESIHAHSCGWNQFPYGEAHCANGCILWFYASGIIHGIRHVYSTFKLSEFNQTVGII